MLEDTSFVPVPMADLTRSRVQAHLESYFDNSSESTGDFLSTDPGRVDTDFDAAMTTTGDYGYGYTPQHSNGNWRSFPPSRGGRSTTGRSYQPTYIKSPLNEAVGADDYLSDLDDEDYDLDDIREEAGHDESTVRYGGVLDHDLDTITVTETETATQAFTQAPTQTPRRQTVSPFGPYEPSHATEQDPVLVPISPMTTTAPPPQEKRLSKRSGSKVSGSEKHRRETSVTPRVSMEVAPPIEAERIEKLVSTINSCIDWARALTEVCYHRTESHFDHS